MSIPSQFNAFRIHHNEQQGHQASWSEMSADELSPGDIEVKVHYSSVNYKDALAGSGTGKILRRFPLNGGIDVAGEVVSSTADGFYPGDKVIATGCGLSETRDGGYSQYIRLDSRWAIPLPEQLSYEQAMTLGTAGFTAALCLYRMEANGQLPEMGPIVVTGATGGVGSIAVNLLSKAGYEVHAISGKVDQFDWLKQLGASQCVARQDLFLGDQPLESASWAGAIDNVGGELLSGLTRVIKPWGNIASCGLAGGIKLHTTVMPFIIRGISILGINSANCPTPLRQELWQRLAHQWRPELLDNLCQRVLAPNDLSDCFAQMLDGQSLGRNIVKIN